MQRLSETIHRIKYNLNKERNNNMFVNEIPSMLINTLRLRGQNRLVFMPTKLVFLMRLPCTKVLNLQHIIFKILKVINLKN